MIFHVGFSFSHSYCRAMFSKKSWHDDLLLPFLKLFYVRLCLLKVVWIYSFECLVSFCCLDPLICEPKYSQVVAQNYSSFHVQTALELTVGWRGWALGIKNVVETSIDLRFWTLCGANWFLQRWFSAFICVLSKILLSVL